jgi:hypothetical protein
MAASPRSVAIVAGVVTVWWNRIEVNLGRSTIESLNAEIDLRSLRLTSNRVSPSIIRDHKGEFALSRDGLKIDLFGSVSREYGNRRSGKHG